MNQIPIRTTVVGSYPFPGWLEFATQNLNKFGKADIEEMIEDAVIAAIHDQVSAGLDVITDGEQTRLDFNLSFYGFINGIENNTNETRKFGPPAHDQRGKYNIVGELDAPNGLGAVAEFQRLMKLAPDGPVLKASVPGPYTLSGRLLPNEKYKDRYAITEALLPIISKELEALVNAGCKEITVDEPSMSCYAYKEDTKRFVDILNRTVKPIVGKCNLRSQIAPASEQPYTMPQAAKAVAQFRPGRLGGSRAMAWKRPDRKSTRLNSSHLVISYAVFCLKKKKTHTARKQYATSWHKNATT